MFKGNHHLIVTKIIITMIIVPERQWMLGTILSILFVGHYGIIATANEAGTVITRRGVDVLNDLHEVTQLLSNRT